MATTTVTIPPALAFLVSNFHSLVNIKLDASNYLLWKTQVENVLDANGFLGYVDGSVTVPPAQIRNATEAMPLTDFPNEKCKRCGFYEKDIFKSDEFDEWEFCPSDFSEPDGRYTHLKDKEFNATFLCPECVHHELDSNNTSETHKRAKGMHWALVLTISISVSAVFVVGSVVAYKYWQKRKREQEHAQFLKLFEEVDDIEDELGLGPLDGIV